MINFEDTNVNKKQLLDTSLFYDNEYLDQYVALVNSHIHDAYEKGKTNKHHIIPKQVYKVLKLPVDNSHGNIVNLLAKEHLVAHCLLTLCSANSEIRRGMFASVLFLSNHKISCMQDIIALLNFNELDLYQKAYELGREEVKQHNPMYDADIKEKHDATMRLESTREKISKSMQIKIERGEFFSAEHRANLSKAQRNTCYIHRGNLTKRITKDELADWQARGWKKGNGQRLSEQHKESLRKSKEGFRYSKESREKMSKSHLGRAPANKGTKRMIKNNKEICVFPKDFGYWIEQGYVFKSKKMNAKYNLDKGGDVK